MVLSPVTHQPAELLFSIPSSQVSQQYLDECNIDVSDYFKDIPEVQVYQCRQTGYRFYYPFNIAGDDKFYEDLQKYDWYYADWKWDYDVAAPFVPENSKVLDIGCGYGNFLTYLKEKKKCDCTGLEFNDKAIETGRNKGLTMYKEFIQEHTVNNAEKYDVVCFFQVLEHISEIDSFMSAAIKTLKKGGKLLICVPNNNPYFYHFDKHHTLNMPPHHMSIWDKHSLTELTHIYPLKVDSFVEENINRYRFYTRLFINARAKNGFSKLIYTLFSPLLFGYFILTRNSIKAGSILAVYDKI